MTILCVCDVDARGHFRKTFVNGQCDFRVPSRHRSGWSVVAGCTRALMMPMHEAMATLAGRRTSHNLRKCGMPNCPWRLRKFSRIWSPSVFTLPRKTAFRSDLFFVAVHRNGRPCEKPMDEARRWTVFKSDRKNCGRPQTAQVPSRL